MKNYVIRFTGKISWEGQMNGLPSEIYAFLIFEGYDRAMFNEAIETQIGAFIRSQTMAVQKDQGQVIDMRQMPQERMLVPFRWIVNIQADVVSLVGELSQPDEQGVERMKDGSEPAKQ